MSLKHAGPHLTAAELAEFEALVTAKTRYSHNIEVYSALRRQKLPPPPELERAVARSRFERHRLRQLAETAAARAGLLSGPTRDNAIAGGGESLIRVEEFEAMKRGATAQPRALGASEQARRERRRQQQQQPQSQSGGGGGGGGGSINAQSAPRPQPVPELTPGPQLDPPTAPSPPPPPPSAQSPPAPARNKQAGAAATRAYRARQKAAGHVLHARVIQHYSTARMWRSRLPQGAAELRQFEAWKRDERTYIRLNDRRRQRQQLGKEVPRAVQQEIERCLASKRAMASAAREWAIADGVLTPEGRVVQDAWEALRRGEAAAAEGEEAAAETGGPLRESGGGDAGSSNEHGSGSTGEPDTTLFQTRQENLLQEQVVPGGRVKSHRPAPVTSLVARIPSSITTAATAAQDNVRRTGGALQVAISAVKPQNWELRSVTKFLPTTRSPRGRFALPRR
jgi:hypothetical protein